MLAKEITYDDYNGITRTEKFYFNISKAELWELAATASGEGYAKNLETIIASNSPQLLANEFKKLLTLAVGQKTEDGQRIDKSEESKKRFIESEAYSEYLFDLIQNQDTTLREFIDNVFPKAKLHKV